MSNTNVSNVNLEFVPWFVVFLVLFAFVFLCSASFTLVGMIKQRTANAKPLAVVASDESVDDLGVKETLQDQSGHQARERLNWMANETQRPIDYLYSSAEQTRLTY